MAGRADSEAVSAYVLKMVMQRIMNKEYPLRRKKYGYRFRLVVGGGFASRKCELVPWSNGWRKWHKTR
ncbi:hypothetical protein BC349_10080 [Flavihumibacter stibioxidans]|uniref:Uncharacterized protein n=1 Tax=Flavihumibacter stibioxidans TaxID=1834163 RepID=A0ABR7M8V4_9BACT|nr:hypothetical protein [Flavihumibacter stibioxidans]